MSLEATSQASPRVIDRARGRLATRTLIIVLSGVLLLGAMAYSLGNGAVDIPTEDVFKALRDQSSVSKLTRVIIHQQRLPRALTGALVGINLAVAGALLQGVVRSPLGDPYILGVSAGGVLVATVAHQLLDDFPVNRVPDAAFLGSLIGASIVYAVAWDGTGITTTRLALSGVALTAMISTITTTIVIITIQGGAQVIFKWLIGTLYAVEWDDYYLIAPYTLVGFVAAMLLASRANILALGDDVARGLGLRVEVTRFLMSAVAALLAGSSVAVAGVVGFVGLLVPYVARKLVGSDYRYLIPTSAILGAALMVWADALSRVTLPELRGEPNQEFPVGMITAIIGGPLFMWLIRVRRLKW